MKKLIFFIALLACFTDAYAQADSVIVWNKWCSRKDTMLLFSSANNLIEIYSPTIKPADIKLKCSGWALRIGNPEVKGDTTLVMAMPYPAKGKNMSLTISNKKTNKVIKTVNFVSDTVPKLIARLGNIHTPEASQKELLAQQTLKLLFPGSLYSYPYQIKQYSFKIESSKGSATMNVNGFFIVKEILQEIHDAPPGAIIQFTNIKVTCPECVVRTLDDIKIKIK